MSIAPAKCLSSCHCRPGHARLGQRVNTDPSGLTVGVWQTGHRAGGAGGGGRSVRSATCGAGESTWGMTSPARSTITSSPSRMSLRARSSSLCSVASLIVTPPTRTGSSIAYGCRSPNFPGFQPIWSRRVTAVVGGNFHATAQRGSRPTTPRRRWSSTSLTLTTTPSISKSSDPRRSSHARHCATTSSSVSSLRTSGWTGKRCSRSQVSASQWDGEADPVGDADGVGPEAQRALGGELGIELADRPGGGVAGVHERREAPLGPALVERGEIGQRHVHLAADLDQRRRIVALQAHRDRADRADVVGHVLADLAVAARGAPLEHAVAVDERHRQTVDLRLGHVLEVRVLDPLARQVVAHPLDPRAQLVGRADVGQATASAAGGGPSSGRRPARRPPAASASPG